MQPYRPNQRRARTHTALRWARRNSLWLAALLLAGCATYQPHPIEPGALARSFEQRSLDDPALQRYIAAHLDGAPPPAGVWTPATLTLAAFYFSPELDLARARYATRHAAIGTAAQRPNPALLLPLGYTVSGGASPYLYGLGLDIPIETAGKRGYRQARAEDLGLAARLGIGEVAWKLRGRLRTGLLDLYRNARRRALVDNRLRTQTQIVALLERRVAVGAASAVETHAARIALARVEAELALADGGSADARARIAAVIGLPLGALRAADIRLDAFERPAPLPPRADARRAAVLNRADLLVALAQYGASQSALQLEIARQYPDIHLGPAVTFDGGAWKVALPLSGIALPLFNRNEGPIAEAKARRKEAAAQVLTVQARSLGAVDRALAMLAAARESLRRADALRSAQALSVQDVQRAFDVGQSDRLALALAHDALAAGDLARLDARVREQQAAGQLEDALQRPLAAGDPAPFVAAGVQRR